MVLRNCVMHRTVEPDVDHNQGKGTRDAGAVAAESAPVSLPMPASPLRTSRAVEGSALARVRADLVRRYYTGQEYVEAARTRKAAMHRYTGTEKSSGAPLRVLYFGSGDHLAYVLGLVYGEYREEEQRENLSVMQARRWLRNSRGRADLFVADLPWPYHRLLRGPGGLEAPAWVDQRLRLPARWEDVFAELRGSARREDQRKIRRHRLSYRIVQDDAAVARFYHDMYVPHVRHRFGGAAYVEPQWKIEYCVARGALMEVLGDGAPIAAQVLYGERGRLQFLWAGTQGAEAGQQPKGAFPALFYFGLLHAFENGFDEADYCGSRPSLADGVLQLKRRWGGAIYDGWSRDTLFFRPFDLGAANLAFLSRSPLVVRRNGGLVGKMAWGPGSPGVEDVERFAQNYATPGLERLRVYSLARPDDEVVAAGAAADCEIVDLSLERDPATALCRD